MKWWASEWTRRIGGRLLGEDFELRRVSIDSRQLEPGAVFFALRGEHQDGAQFIPAALQRGAIAAVVQEKQPLDCPQVLVPDVAAALRTLGQWKREQSPARFIGITGSNGKTSSKEMLAALLRPLGKTAATRGNLNNHLGVPLTLAQLDGDEDFVVVEMGANHRGEIAELCALLRPHFGLISNVAAAHLAGFGDLDGVIETKEALFAAAEHVVLNLDVHPRARQRWEALFAAKIRLRYGLHQGDIWAQLEDEQGTRFRIQPAQQAIHWRRYGLHNVSNALGAAALLQAMGLPAQALSALNDFQMDSGGRLQAVPQGMHLILDDSYNANPDSFRAALQVLASFHNAGRHVFAGLMAELGTEQEAAHRALRQEALRLGLEHFYAVECPDYGLPPLSLEEARTQLKALLRAQTPQVILIKGSRSAALERLRQNIQ